VIHPDTEVRWINDQVGRGVVATRLIPKGTIVWTQCEFDIVFSPERLEKLPTVFKEIATVYGYVDQVGDTILCWDHGRYVNHSCDPAMLSLGHKIEIAVRDIQPGEELTCDYGTLNYGATLQCMCARPGCRGLITAEDALGFDGAWMAKLREAVSVASQVAQPLVAFVHDVQEWESYLSGDREPPTADHYYFHGSKGGA